MKQKSFFITFLSALVLSAGISASAQSEPVQHSEQSIYLTSENTYSAFVPKVDPANATHIDYQKWDDFLYGYVLYTGPSAREYLRRPLPNAGSRKYYGHTSPYRAEGNRFMFSQVDDKVKSFIADYRLDLVDIGNRTDIQAMPENEQLAYWANLHNVVLIDTLLQEYPIKDPRDYTPPGHSETLQDAKLITLKGVPLSLRDIRENIVFQNWEDPRVIYMFWTAEISGPNLHYMAFTSSNLWQLADDIAEEYANSLRGFQVHREKRLVSQFYKDHQKFYFPNFEVDLTAHMRPYVKGSLLADFDADYPLEIDRYYKRIADVGGGYRPRLFNRAGSYDVDGYDSPTEARMLQRFARKRERLIRDGVIKERQGVVIIEDIETIDDFEVPEIQFKSTLTFKPAQPVEEQQDTIESEETIEE